MMGYYRDHLEDFNEEFRNQMAEFRDGNLFFEIMQQEIWNKAQNDSAAVAALYEKNKSKYLWQPSADAVIFFCSDDESAKQLYGEMKNMPGNWKQYTAALTEKVVADSARYEWDQIPNLNKTIPKAGMVTTPLTNENDNTSSFAYIVHVYPNVMPRNFNEAKGMAINDYQNLLEEQWMQSLKKKYPVRINQKVLAAISK
jgi:peptidyl-prolyl cis-trans isomerase SurA